MTNLPVGNGGRNSSVGPLFDAPPTKRHPLGTTPPYVKKFTFNRSIYN